MRTYKNRFIGKIIVFALFLGLYGGLFAAPKLTVVVIDAGHGGKDAGAVGKTTLEKDINLAVALGLGEMIESHYKDVKVHYTRKEDEFIDVWKRPQIANKHKANLFISIHCNSSELKRNAPLPKGFETFVMGLHKSADNLAVAQKENAAILLENEYEEKYNGFNPNSPEAYIMFSLFQNVYLEQSSEFALRLQNHYREQIPSMDRGVKQAGFLVLHGAAMPSVLTEIGFINNPEEEDFMATAEGQGKIIAALFNAFREYKNKIEGTPNAGTASETEQEKPKVDTVKNENTPIPVRVLPQPLDTSVKLGVLDDTTTVVTSEKSTPKVVYKVQFSSSSFEMPLDAPAFKNIDKVGRYYHGGSYKYTSGEAKTMEEAVAILRKIQEQGYKDAFVVVFKDDERITTSEALKILQEQEQK